MSVFDKVKEIIVKELKIEADKVTLDAKLKEDLGADSLDAVEIVMDIEDEFDLEIDDSAAESVTTVGDLVKAIEQNVK